MTDPHQAAQASHEDAVRRHLAATNHVAAADLHVLIVAAIAHITTDLATVRQLLTAPQAGIGFLTVEAAKVQGDLIRAERRERHRMTKEGIVPTGEVPAPAAIAAYSLIAETDDLLNDIADRVTTRLARARVSSIHTRPLGHDATTADRADRTALLVGHLTRLPTLRRFHTELEDLHTRITRYIEGAYLLGMPDPCPWCHRHTLVADLNTGVITCGRDPDTGNHETCLCTDSYCPCHAAGRHRHTWHRDHRAHKTTSWQGLRRAINTTEEQP